jgi:hypothetical protein
MEFNMYDTKSPMASKINWTQLVGLLAVLGTVFGLDLDPDFQAQLVATLVAAQAFITIMWRTWFTSKKIKVKN